MNMAGSVSQLKLLGILLLFADLSLQNNRKPFPHRGTKPTGGIKKPHGGDQRTLNRQRRAWIIDAFELVEELPGPYPHLIGKVSVDEEALVKFRISGKGVDEDPKGLFRIDEDGGSIYVLQKIDFEVTPLFQWEFNSIMRTTELVDTKLRIQLKILDINDNAPEFNADSYEVSINESFVQGGTFLTMLAHDKDEHSSPNSLVHYYLLSQTPADPNVEFTVDKEKGFISFKGCLNYETNKNYKLVIQAKDNGVPTPLSSTCEVLLSVVDGNNHPPEWTTDSFHARVPEREINVTVLKFAVTDRDTRDTPAWRAVYSITAGNEKGNYKIQTDPKTNEGILTVVKALDYETDIQSKLSIAVENEEPYFTCKVVQKLSTGLWVLESAKGRSAKNVLESRSAVVDITDVNDPPKFYPDKVILYLEETTVGPDVELTKLNALDTDILSPNKIKYIIDKDPASWLSVNEDTGVLKTKAQLDRESDHVTSSTYTATIVAIDDGIPPLTSTATVVINLKDVNDNAPTLGTPYLTICESEEEVILTAPVTDKDVDPYSGPFHFEIVDKDLREIPLKLMESHGDSLRVMKLRNALQGNYTLHLAISDRQGITSLQNLTVYVCECLDGRVCVQKMTVPPVLGRGAIALLLLTPLLFFALSFLLCKVQTKKVMVPVEQETLDSIVLYNEEGGNKDCEASAVADSELASSNQSQVGAKNEVDGDSYRSSTRRFSTSIDVMKDKMKDSRSNIVPTPAIVMKDKMKDSRSNSVPAYSHKETQGNGTGTFDRATARRQSAYSHKETQGNGTGTFDRATARRQLAYSHKETQGNGTGTFDRATARRQSAYSHKETQGNGTGTFDRATARRQSAYSHKETQGNGTGTFDRATARRQSAQPYKETQGNGTGTFDRATARRHSSFHFSNRRTSTFDRANTRRDSVGVGTQRTSAVGNHSERMYPPTALDTILNQKLISCEDEIDRCKVRVFTYEGELSRASSLDAISISSSNFELENLQYLGSKFNILENICTDRVQQLEEPKEEPMEESMEESKEEQALLTLH
ncbi:cadherin-like protein 26 isoform X5 [Ascaphus truei]|uniref:cadherin-like protein 26 isoform X5 n=1 Tax=Ascaphus truei TaxID=8439 RepID=UPI003F5A5806